MRRKLLAIVIMLALAACGGARPTSAPDNLTCNLVNYTVQDAYSELHGYAQRLKAAHATTRTEINMLELSAGGEFGSYGAGFLVGWGKAGAGAKPVARDNIQIVTGVSTGALMATYTFLGQGDDVLEKFYLGLTDAQLYSQRSLSLLWSNSLFDASGKQKILRDRITSDVIDAVAQQPPTRGLYIGFANLDSGEFVRIDMKKLANGDFPTKAQRDACYRAVIDGATAIEVAFPPAFIDGRMFGDGGVRQHVFLVSPKSVQTSDADVVDLSNVTLRLITLIHGDLGVVDQTPGKDGATGVQNGVLYVAERAADIFTDQVLKGSIRLSNDLATDPAAIARGKQANKMPHYETYYAAAAAAACACRQQQDVMKQCGSTSSAGADIFCPPYMQCLAQKGETEGERAAATGEWVKFASLPLDSAPSCSRPVRVRFR